MIALDQRQRIAGNAIDGSLIRGLLEMQADDGLSCKGTKVNLPNCIIRKQTSFTIAIRHPASYMLKIVPSGVQISSAGILIRLKPPYSVLFHVRYSSCQLCGIHNNNVTCSYNSFCNFLDDLSFICLDIHMLFSLV